MVDQSDRSFTDIKGFGEHRFSCEINKDLQGFILTANRGKIKPPPGNYERVCVRQCVFPTRNPNAIAHGLIKLFVQLLTPSSFLPLKSGEGCLRPKPASPARMGLLVFALR
jgi:hypothetical protein